MNNPYSAPGANVGVAGAASYQPRFLSAHGRIGRLRYLAYGFGASMLVYLAAIPLMVIAGVVGGASAGSEGSAALGVGMMLVMAVMYVALIAVMIIYTKRRLNDLGKTGWLALLYLVPIVNLFLWIYIQFFPGDKTPNQYGPAPVPNSGGVVALAVIMLVVMLLSIVGIIMAVSVPAYQDYLNRAQEMQQIQE